MAPYIPINNSTIGLDGLMTYAKTAMETAQPGIGGSSIGLMLIIPLFIIIFWILSRQNPLAGFTVASFVCWLASVMLIASQLISPYAFGVTFVMWIAGAIAFYLQTRD